MTSLPVLVLSLKHNNATWENVQLMVSTPPGAIGANAMQPVALMELKQEQESVLHPSMVVKSALDLKKKQRLVRNS